MVSEVQVPENRYRRRRGRIYGDVVSVSEGWNVSSAPPSENVEKKEVCIVCTREEGCMDFGGSIIYLAACCRVVCVSVCVCV